MASEKIIGFYSQGGKISYGNLVLLLSLSLSDRNQLVQKYKDQSDWIEVRIPASAGVYETKRGRHRCWLMPDSAFQKAFAASGYKNKGVTPLGQFNPSGELLIEYSSKR